MLSKSFLSYFHSKKSRRSHHTKKFITNAMQHNHMFFSCAMWHDVAYVMLRVIYRRWTTHVFSVVLSSSTRWMNSLTHYQKIYFLSAPLRKKIILKNHSVIRTTPRNTYVCYIPRKVFFFKDNSKKFKKSSGGHSVKI